MELKITTQSQLAKVWANWKMSTKQLEKVCGFRSYHSGGTGKGMSNSEDVSAFNSTRKGTFIALSPSSGNGNKQALSLHCHHQTATNRHFHCIVTIKWQQTGNFTALSLSNGNGNRHFHCSHHQMATATNRHFHCTFTIKRQQALSLHCHHQMATNRHFHYTVTIKWQQTGTFTAPSPSNSNSNKQALLLHCHHQTATNRHFHCTVTIKQQQTGTFIALSPSNSKGKHICQQHSLVFAE